MTRAMSGDTWSHLLNSPRISIFSRMICSPLCECLISQFVYKFGLCSFPRPLVRSRLLVRRLRNGKSRYTQYTMTLAGRTAPVAPRSMCIRFQRSVASLPRAPRRRRSSCRAVNKKLLIVHGYHPFVALMHRESKTAKNQSLHRYNRPARHQLTGGEYESYVTVSYSCCVPAPYVIVLVEPLK